MTSKLDKLVKEFTQRNREVMSDLEAREILNKIQARITICLDYEKVRHFSYNEFEMHLWANECQEK